MDAFRFQDPRGGSDGVTWFVTLRTIEPDLQWQDLREIVADVFLSRDGEHYKIGDFVVLPDQVQLLVGMYPERDVGEQCRDWIDRSTAEINASRSRSGEFWNSAPKVERIRDWDEFDAHRKFIRRSPRSADLRVGEYYLHVNDDV